MILDHISVEKDPANTDILQKKSTNSSVPHSSSLVIFNFIQNLSVLFFPSFLQGPSFGTIRASNSNLGLTPRKDGVRLSRLRGFRRRLLQSTMVWAMERTSNVQSFQHWKFLQNEDQRNCVGLQNSRFLNKGRSVSCLNICEVSLLRRLFSGTMSGMFL